MNARPAGQCPICEEPGKQLQKWKLQWICWDCLRRALKEAVSGNGEHEKGLEE